ncbi:MAG: hypothetical protein ACFB20_02495 [Opitutales bacterium]
MKSILTLGMLSLATVFATVSAHAGSDKNTAAYLKAHVDKLEDKAVSVEVPFVRVLPALSDNESYVVFWVPTVNTEDNLPGGHILAVADAEDKDKLISRYGLNADREGRREVETKRMRGILRQIPLARPDNEEAVAEEEAIQRGPVFLDLTEAGIDGDEALSTFIRKHDKPARRGRP